MYICNVNNKSKWKFGEIHLKQQNFFRFELRSNKNVEKKGKLGFSLQNKAKWKANKKEHKGKQKLRKITVLC